MNIIDSSCWLEYLMNTEIGANVASIIENPSELIVPTIVLYEVYKKLLAVLYSCDKHFKDFPNVRYFSKTN